MKYAAFMLVCSFLVLMPDANAQNVGIGTTGPSSKLHVVGNFLVNVPYTSTNTPPTPSQTKTMVNNVTLYLFPSDSTGRIYDPGGPTGDYISNLNAYVYVYGGSNIGYEVKLEEIALNTGDSLIIKENNSTNDILLAVGNGYTTPGTWVFNTNGLFIIFKSNGDGNNASGFNLLLRRLYDNASSLPLLSGIVGTTMFFDVKTGSLRSGTVTNTTRGLNSVGLGTEIEASGDWSFATGTFTDASGFGSTALGFNTTASGYNATSFGESTTASGENSTSFGVNTIANGQTSTSFGGNTIASGSFSTAFGRYTTAGSIYSTAMGFKNEALADYSTVIGTRMKVGTAAYGALGIGDLELSEAPGDITNVLFPNEFVARFRGGYYFMTTSNAPGGSQSNRLGVQCGAGQNSWSAISDIRRKENFMEVDGEAFLQKIATMPQYTWNYKGQSAATFRHYGPMAQDINAAFGKDALGAIGCDTLINQQDLLGIQFIAIQALEKRTTELQAQVDSLMILLHESDQQNASIVTGIKGKQVRPKVK